MSMTAEKADISLTVIAREIDAVACYLQELRAAINGLRVPELTTDKLGTARQDLASVADVMRSAADVILDKAEAVLSASGANLPDSVQGHVLDLMQACSFQDLAGQRLTRVVMTLDGLEERLAEFAATVHAANGELRGARRETARAIWRQSQLIHGPSNIGAMGQNEIDELLAS